MARRDVQQYLQDLNKLLPWGSREIKKRETSTDISRGEFFHWCCAGFNCALCLTVGNDYGVAACLVCPCSGGRAVPWAHRLMLLEAMAGYTNPSLLGESHDMNKMWETPSQILQVLFSIKHLLPLLPHLSILSPASPDVTAGVTLLPSCFSSTCVQTNWSHSNTTAQILWSHIKAFLPWPRRQQNVSLISHSPGWPRVWCAGRHCDGLWWTC